MNVFLILGFFFFSFKRSLGSPSAKGVLLWAFGQQKKYFYYIELAATIVFIFFKKVLTVK